MRNKSGLLREVILFPVTVFLVTKDYIQTFIKKYREIG